MCDFYGLSARLIVEASLNDGFLYLRWWLLPLHFVRSIIREVDSVAERTWDQLLRFADEARLYGLSFVLPTKLLTFVTR